MKMAHTIGIQIYLRELFIISVHNKHIVKYSDLKESPIKHIVKYIALKELSIKHMVYIKKQEI